MAERRMLYASLDRFRLGERRRPSEFQKALRAPDAARRQDRLCCIVALEFSRGRKPKNRPRYELEHGPRFDARLGED